jgi:hypothetical protein
MSELVEKVQDAIFKAYDFNGIATEKMSRAAIAAVAEWLKHRDQDHWHSAEMMRFTARKLEEQLEQPK